jgi:hypothetical protein
LKPAIPPLCIKKPALSYHCFEGQGQTIIKAPCGKKSKIDWVAKDTFAVPAWSEVQHINKSSNVSHLFAINDRPLAENLGLSVQLRKLIHRFPEIFLLWRRFGLLRKAVYAKLRERLSGHEL